MGKLVVNEGVGVLARHLEITDFGVTRNAVSVIGAESLVVLQAFGTIWLLRGCISIVYSIQAFLTWFVSRVWFLTI